MRWMKTLYNAIFGISSSQLPPPQTPIERRDWLVRHMDESQATAALSKVQHSAFKRLTERLINLDFIIGADTGFNPSMALQVDRLGLTLLVTNYPPIIWLNLHRLNRLGEAELVDTVIHEAIHATSGILQRAPELPDYNNPKAYLLEEITARTGANFVLRQLTYPGREVIRKNKLYISKHGSSLRDIGATRLEIDQASDAGRIAGKFLLEGIATSRPR